MAEYIHIYCKNLEEKEEIIKEADKLELSASSFLKACYEFYKEEKSKRSSNNGAALHKAEGGTL